MRANRVVASSAQCWLPRGEGTPPNILGKLPYCFPTSRIQRSYQARMRKRGETFQQENRAEEDGHHMEDSLLSENKGSRGAKGLFGDVGSERLEFQLDPFDGSLFYLSFTLLFFAFCIFAPSGVKIPWVESNSMRKEHVGILVLALGVTMGTSMACCSTGTSEPDVARTSCCSLGRTAARIPMS